MLVKRIILFIALCIPALVNAQNLPVSLDSMNRFFLKLDKESRFETNNLEFMIQQNHSSKSLAYEFLTKNADAVNKRLNYPGVVDKHIKSVIIAECIEPGLWTNGNRKIPVTNNPDWKKLKATIQKKYGDRFVESTITDAQIMWYEYKQDYPNLIKYTIQNIDRNGLDTAGMGRNFLNNMIYELIFMYGTDTAALNKGLKWSKIIIDTERPSANHYDTYANLLYKLGRKDEALQWQSKALAIEPTDPGLKETYEKMKNDIPTWSVSN